MVGGSGSLFLPVFLLSPSSPLYFLFDPHLRHHVNVCLYRDGGCGFLYPINGCAFHRLRLHGYVRETPWFHRHLDTSRPRDGRTRVTGVVGYPGARLEHRRCRRCRLGRVVRLDVTLLAHPEGVGGDTVPSPTVGLLKPVGVQGRPKTSTPKRIGLPTFGSRQRPTELCSVL